MPPRQAHGAPEGTTVPRELVPCHRNQCGKEIFVYGIFTKILFIMPLSGSLILSSSPVP